VHYCVVGVLAVAAAGCVLTARGCRRLQLSYSTAGQKASQLALAIVHTGDSVCITGCMCMSTRASAALSICGSCQVGAHMLASYCTWVWRIFKCYWQCLCVWVWCCSAYCSTVCCLQDCWCESMHWWWLFRFLQGVLSMH
jgi:hypothetical protein